MALSRLDCHDTRANAQAKKAQGAMFNGPRHTTQLRGAGLPSGPCVHCEVGTLKSLYAYPQLHNQLNVSRSIDLLIFNNIFLDYK